MTAATEPTTQATTPAGPEPEDPTVEILAADDTDAEPAETPARRKRLAAAVAAAITTWWGFIRQPMSLREAWDRSGVIDARRIPGDSQLLAAIWYVSNRVDRVLLFLAVLVLPTFLNGPVLWCAVRPSRRLGLYLVLFTVFVIVRAATRS